MKWPWIKWFVSDWLADPQVSRCQPATRGIWFDWLLNMHATDRTGQVTGTREDLARLGRCSVPQVDEALEDLSLTNAANVQKRNGIVTVVNRRMKREYLQRKSTRFRVEKHRCNAHSQSQSQSHIPEVKSSGFKGAFSGRGSGGNPSTREVELLELYAEVCGDTSLKVYGGAWRLRIRKNPDLVERVLFEVRDMKKRGKVHSDCGAAAADLWKLWGNQTTKVV